MDRPPGPSSRLGPSRAGGQQLESVLRGRSWGSGALPGCGEGENFSVSASLSDFRAVLWLPQHKVGAHQRFLGEQKWGLINACWVNKAEMGSQLPWVSLYSSGWQDSNPSLQGYVESGEAPAQLPRPPGPLLYHCGSSRSSQLGPRPDLGTFPERRRLLDNQ